MRAASFVCRSISSIAGLFLLLALAACSSSNRPRNEIAIVDVTVVDVQSGTGLSHMDVVIDGEKIDSVGPTAAQAPNAESVINGKGKFLIPGLWDMHIHVADDPRALGLLLAAGITGAREMANIPEKALEARKQIQEGALDGPRLLIAGPALSAPPADADYNTWIVRTPEEARETVDKLVNLKVDFIKVHDHLSAASYRAIAESATAKGIPFVGHVSEHITPLEASNLGQKSIEHFEYLPKPCLTLFDPKQPVAAGCDQASLDSLMKTFAKNGTWLDPTVSAFRFFDPSQWPAAKSLYRNLAVLMRRNGVKILAGTDQSSYLESKGSFPGQSLHEELTFFVDAGFTPAEALRAATSGPAEFLGLTDSAGSIQAGRTADLVLLNADPIQDIHNTSRIAAVIKRGRLYDLVALLRLHDKTP